MTTAPVTSLHHRVRQLSCETFYQGFLSDSTLSTLEDEMEAFLKQALPTLLDKVFDQHDKVDQVYYVKKVNINIPLAFSGDKEALKKQLLHECESQLLTALQKLTVANNKANDKTKNGKTLSLETLNAHHLHKEKVEREAVLYYLRYGFLTWKHQPYRSHIATILNQQIKKGNLLGDISALIKRNKNTLPRLMQLLDTQQDFSLFSWMSPGQGGELFAFWNSTEEKLNTDINNQQYVTPNAANNELSTVFATMTSDTNIHSVMRQVMLSAFFTIDHKRLTSSQLLGRLIAMLAETLSVEPPVLWQWLHYRFVSPTQQSSGVNIKQRAGMSEHLSNSSNIDQLVEQDKVRRPENKYSDNLADTLKGVSTADKALPPALDTSQEIAVVNSTASVDQQEIIPSKSCYQTHLNKKSTVSESAVAKKNRFSDKFLERLQENTEKNPVSHNPQAEHAVIKNNSLSDSVERLQGNTGNNPGSQAKGTVIKKSAVPDHFVEQPQSNTENSGGSFNPQAKAEDAVVEQGTVPDHFVEQPQSHTENSPDSFNLQAKAEDTVIKKSTVPDHFVEQLQGNTENSPGLFNPQDKAEDTVIQKNTVPEHVVEQPQSHTENSHESYSQKTEGIAINRNAVSDQFSVQPQDNIGNGPDSQANTEKVLTEQSLLNQMHKEGLSSRVETSGVKTSGVMTKIKAGASEAPLPTAVFSSAPGDKPYGDTVHEPYQKSNNVNSDNAVGDDIEKQGLTDDTPLSEQVADRLTDSIERTSIQAKRIDINDVIDAADIQNNNQQIKNHLSLKNNKATTETSVDNISSQAYLHNPFDDVMDKTSFEVDSCNLSDEVVDNTSSQVSLHNPSDGAMDNTSSQVGLHNPSDGAMDNTSSQVGLHNPSDGAMDNISSQVGLHNPSDGAIDNTSSQVGLHNLSDDTIDTTVDSNRQDNDDGIAAAIIQQIRDRFSSIGVVKKSQKLLSVEIDVPTETLQNTAIDETSQADPPLTITNSDSSAEQDDPQYNTRVKFDNMTDIINFYPQWILQPQSTVNEQLLNILHTHNDIKQLSRSITSQQFIHLLVKLRERDCNHLLCFSSIVVDLLMDARKNKYSSQINYHTGTVKNGRRASMAPDKPERLLLLHYLILSFWVLPDKKFQRADSVFSACQFLADQLGFVLDNQLESAVNFETPISDIQTQRDAKPLITQLKKQQRISKVQQRIWQQRLLSAVAVWQSRSRFVDNTHDLTTPNTASVDQTMRSKYQHYRLLTDYINDDKPILQLLKKVCLSQKAASDNQLTRIIDTGRPDYSVDEYDKKEAAVLVLNEPIPIANAGLVLVSAYIDRLFRAFAWINLNDGLFVDTQCAEKAMMLLGYLASGQRKANEIDLSLNKLLCGIPLENYVCTDVALEEEVYTTADSLLNAVINHWSALGSTTIDGLRGSFLLRNGWLNKEQERWSLTVESKAFDMLLDQIPWGFSLIKHAWMPLPLSTQWRDKT